MKIKYIQFYQGVKFHNGKGNVVRTHIRMDDSAEVQAELMPNLGVRVTSSHDDVIISFNNVAYMQLEKEEAKVKKEAKPKAG